MTATNAWPWKRMSDKSPNLISKNIPLGQELKISPYLTRSGEESTKTDHKYTVYKLETSPDRSLCFRWPSAVCSATQGERRRDQEQLPLRQCNISLSKHRVD